MENNEQVPGGIHVRKLQIRDSNGGDDSGHHHENSTNNGVWNADEQCSNFTKNTNGHYNYCTILDDTTTCNLRQGSMKVYVI